MPKLQKKNSEGLRFARLLMVLSSFAPLFLLMAIRGNSLFPELYFSTAFLLLAILPTAFLFWRLHVARKNNDARSLVTGRTEDQRSQLLAYLFATLLPFYREEIANFRDLLAMCVALGLIVFLFWRLKFHYLNLFFAMARYNVYTISPPDDGNPYSGQESFVLITRRKHLLQNERIHAIRLSNTVYLEEST